MMISAPGHRSDFDSLSLSPRMSSILQAQRREAANLVELMRRQGVHQALNEAILTVYMSGTNSPSDMLDEILHQMGSVRVPPVPEKVRLPLRAKDDFVYALQMSSLQSALKPGVQALDEARRGVKQLDAGEAIGAGGSTQWRRKGS